MVKTSADALLDGHQRHPRLLEDRGRQARPGPDRLRACATALGDTLQAAGPARAQEGAGAGLPHRRPTCPTAWSATPAGCGRSSSTWSATPSSSPSAARWSSRVEQMRMQMPQTDDLQSAICNLQFAVRDTGIGIPADKLAAIFEAVRAGRRLDDAQVRRHRPGPDHLAAAGRADGRPHLGRERGRPGQHLPLHRPRSACGAAGAGGARPPAGGLDGPAGPGRGRQRHQSSHPRGDAAQLAA